MNYRLKRTCVVNKVKGKEKNGLQGQQLKSLWTIENRERHRRIVIA